MTSWAPPPCHKKEIYPQGCTKNESVTDANKISTHL
jgi:hypothetical protein